MWLNVILFDWHRILPYIIPCVRGENSWKKYHSVSYIAFSFISLKQLYSHQVQATLSNQSRQQVVQYVEYLSLIAVCITAPLLHTSQQCKKEGFNSDLVLGPYVLLCLNALQRQVKI